MDKKKNLNKLFILLLSLMIICALLASCSAENKATVPSGTEESASTAEPSSALPSQIFAWQLADGTYKIDVKSSTSMFRVTDARLNVRDGAMSLVMTMSGQGFGKVYMGTAEQALAEGDDAGIPFVLDENGAKTFTVPVSALNSDTDCAAWSVKKKKWYDHVLVFESGLLPNHAFSCSNVADGEYLVDAVLTGGTGRAHIESPLHLTVKNGAAVATIIWSSPNYESVTIQGVPFRPVQKEGNSTFLIPAALDVDIPLTGRTVAMSEPHDIDYVLRLDASTLKPCEGNTP